MSHQFGLLFYEFPSGIRDVGAPDITGVRRTKKEIREEMKTQIAV